MNNSNTRTTITGTTTSLKMRQALVRAIDHGLLALGQIPRQTIYHRIQRNHSIRREEIPEKLQSFHDALRELLGQCTEIVERLIAKTFYSSLGLDFTNHKQWTLLDYVSNVNRPDRSASDSRDCATISVLSRTVPENVLLYLKPSGGKRDVEALEPVTTWAVDHSLVGFRRRPRTAASSMYTLPAITAWILRAPR